MKKTALLLMIVQYTTIIIHGSADEMLSELAQGEDKNRRLWASKDTPKVRVEP